MDNVLTLHLAEIEKSRPINNDRDLLGAILGIIEKERSKRAEKRNYDLLEEAIDASFALEGRDKDEIASDADAVRERALAAIPAEPENGYSQVRVKLLLVV